jgi:hypothetical protein
MTVKSYQNYRHRQPLLAACHCDEIIINAFEKMLVLDHILCHIN